MYYNIVKLFYNLLSCLPDAARMHAHMHAHTLDVVMIFHVLLFPF